MKINGWGKYPTVDANILKPYNFRDCATTLEKHSFISRGLGRSYGDSGLSTNVMDMLSLDKYIEFDEITGVLSCYSGVSFNKIINDFLPRGWFLPVSPGSSFVTIGGAIASDVHGKNHHISGSFCNFVKSIDLLLGNGELVTISENQYQDLFRATCGGMGLTGVIISASFQLIQINSNIINLRTIKTANIDEALDVFESYEKSQYTVAWIDCMAKGVNLGRSIISVGEHALEGPKNYESKSSIRMPFNMPNNFINFKLVKIFNAIYYHKNLKKINDTKTNIKKFFYPLDAINDWNLLYGKKGFLQYQFVIPKKSGVAVLKIILEKISKSKLSSPLGVLKVFGKGNNNLLSFPMEGYTLALDFNYSENIFQTLNEIDELLIEYGGRIYLTKDSRMSEETFKSTYKNWIEFENIRDKYHAIGKFFSSQSLRLGLK